MRDKPADSLKRLDVTARPYQGEGDYERIRGFLRDVFVLNGRREHSWHVARLDYWRWHFIRNCRLCGPMEDVLSIWETTDGTIAALVNPLGSGEIRLHVHPHFRTRVLEDEMVAVAEKHLSALDRDGRHLLYLPVDTTDQMRRDVLLRRGFDRLEFTSEKWYRDLESHLSEAPLVPGYAIRSMGGLDEHPARSLASWRAFHSDEPDEDYDGDWSWYRNIQSAPLYRRDLDIVAATPQGEIAAFAVIYYDDVTRSAVCVLVGTAAEHQRRGLARAVMLEGFNRLKRLGGKRVFATGYDDPAKALYRSVMQTHDVDETWCKRS